MHNEEDDSWGRYAAACIRQLSVGVGFVRRDDREALVRLRKIAGPETTRVVHVMLEQGAAAVWFFTEPSDLEGHLILTKKECVRCRTEIERQGWCVWVQGLLPCLPMPYHQADPPSH